MIGRLLDEQYRVVAPLGRGGMGEVYLVENLRESRTEALKVLREELQAIPDLVARFRRETRANRRLDHPNIVEAYDVGELEDGRLYLTMEVVQAEPLDQVLASRGPLPEAEVIGILVQLASALGHAHACGVVHRDLKPSNLLLSTEDTEQAVLKVLDFGIAKIIDSQYQESLKISKTGQVFGSIDYMAPERFSGNTDDPRSDLYALGCIGYELLTANRPFVGETLADVMRAHISAQRTAPSKALPSANISPELDALVLTCLAVSVTNRHSDARELLQALKRLPQEAMLRVATSSPGKAESQQAATERIAVPRRDFDAYANALYDLANAILEAGIGDAQLVHGINRLKYAHETDSDAADDLYRHLHTLRHAAAHAPEVARLLAQLEQVRIRYHQQ